MPITDREPADDNDSRFITGTLFDISQTDEIVPGQKFTPEQPEEQEAPAPRFSPAIPEPAAEIPATEPSPEPMPAIVAQPQDGFLF